MTLTTAVVGDRLTHNAVIVTGSGTRRVNGQQVARLGDMVACPIHGRNPIIQVLPNMPYTDGRLTAHQTAKSACGAVVLPSSFSASSTGRQSAQARTFFLSPMDTIMPAFTIPENTQSIMGDLENGSAFDTSMVNDIGSQL